MKKICCPTSNEKLNVPMTAEQWDVVDFIGLEAETARVYPFAVDFDDVTMDMVDGIVAGCNGHTNDTETLYGECERVLGINPDLIKKRTQNEKKHETKPPLKDRIVDAQFRSKATCADNSVLVRNEHTRD